RVLIDPKRHARVVTIEVDRADAADHDVRRLHGREPRKVSHMMEDRIDLDRAAAAPARGEAARDEQHADEAERALHHNHLNARSRLPPIRSSSPPSNPPGVLDGAGAGPAEADGPSSGSFG